MTEPIITRLLVRSVWDSRGRPTIEAELHLASGVSGRAIAPAGASTGSGEARDKRDGGNRFGGFGVDQAIEAVRDRVAPALIGMDASDQPALDARLEAIDGTGTFQNIGGNSAVAISMAAAHAAAAHNKLPLWAYLSGGGAPLIPVPEIQIFGGGAHASRRLDLQDFMIAAHGAKTFREALDWTAEIYLAAGKRLAQRGALAGVADEGGYWPDFSSNEAALDALTRSVEDAGFKAPQQVALSIDVAATQLFGDGAYHLAAENRRLSQAAWHDQLSNWLRTYPILMIEDPFTEHDLDATARFTKEWSSRVQIIGDDLLVTDARRVEAAHRAGAATALLCKPNQAGTLTRARAAFEAARRADMSTIVSARSGETEDTTICHLAVGWASGQLKVGSFTRSERMAKWNEMLRIEESLGAASVYAGGTLFKSLLAARE